MRKTSAFRQFDPDYTMPTEIARCPLLNDASYGNDDAPKMRVNDCDELYLWVDHPDAEAREMISGADKRFGVSQYSPDGVFIKHLIETDNVDEAIVTLLRAYAALPSTNPVQRIVANQVAGAIELDQPEPVDFGFGPYLA